MQSRKLVLASAGAGKTFEIVEEAVARFKAGETVLIITYTQNNQNEITRRIAREIGAVPDRIRIKGWFTFLLGDLVRPYQRDFFRKRITNIHFNTDINPHKIPGTNYQMPGRQEYNSDKSLNPRHYLTSSMDRAHTAFLAKLACRIAESKETSIRKKEGRKTTKYGFAFQRLGEIYNTVIVDEVQDFTGWDYEILAKLSQVHELNIICVGDFRQTVYLTHHDRKSPKDISEKIEAFEKMGFDSKNKFFSHRCAQPICDFADKIHAYLKLPPTKSLADYKDIEHLGVFAVSNEHIDEYFSRYKPVLLRNKKSVSVEFCRNKEAYNFGEAKGLQFPRILVIPTQRQQDFIKGDDAAFKNMRTDQEINRFYVAITRAKYSTAIVFDDPHLREGIAKWVPIAQR